MVLKISRLRLFVSAVCFLGVGASVRGAVLADYSFASSSAESGDADANSAAGTFTVSGGGVVTDDTARFGSNSTGSTEDGAVTANDYFEFTMTITGGHELNLASLTFGTAFYGDQTVAGNGSFFVRTSVDGFASTIGSVFNEATYQRTTTAGPPYPLPVFTPRSVSLSAPGFQGLQDTVTIRIYVFDSTSSSERFDAINAVVLNGDAVESGIPESSSCAPVAGAAAVFFAGLRRRRRMLSG